MRIIGFSGKAGAGKDTAAELMQNYLNRQMDVFAHKQNLADALKEYCSLKYGISKICFYDQHLKTLQDEYWGVSPREILQFEGTEATRDIIGKLLPYIGADFWIRRLVKNLEDHVDYLIVADIRFQNEADWLLNNGNYLINITRPGADGKIGISNHASEAGFTVPDNQEYYYEVNNNSTIEHLNSQIINLAERIHSS